MPTCHSSEDSHGQADPGARVPEVKGGGCGSELAPSAFDHEESVLLLETDAELTDDASSPGNVVTRRESGDG